MKIIYLVSHEKRNVTISKVQEEEFKLLTKKRYFFNWKILKNKAVIYKLQLNGEDDILGLMALIEFPAELRIQIELIATSVENKGKNKKYDGIIGCLIAFASRLSLLKYGSMACVSLVPKTLIKRHYMDKYGMVDAGKQLYLDGKNLFNIIKKYNL